jgi:hypothetical protein
MRGIVKGALVYGILAGIALKADDISVYRLDLLRGSFLMQVTS